MIIQQPGQGAGRSSMGLVPLRPDCMHPPDSRVSVPYGTQHTIAGFLQWAAGEVNATSVFHPGRDGNKTYILCNIVPSRAKQGDTATGPQGRFSGRGDPGSTPSIRAKKRRDGEQIARSYNPQRGCATAQTVLPLFPIFRASTRCRLSQKGNFTTRLPNHFPSKKCIIIGI